MKKKRVIVAPLDWGLGHATRCIPIIDELMKRECEVFIASCGSALELLRKEFPHLQYLHLASYKANYSSRLPLVVSMIFQVPKFLKTISREHQQLEQLIDEHLIDLVIADNRYGCWTRKKQCIFITHQLNIQTPSWLRWLKPVVRYANHKMVRRFSYCWIPDAQQQTLSGGLSENGSLEVKYIGLLSRFNNKPVKGIPSESKPFLKVAAILSGPEPQRTVFECIVLQNLKLANQPSILVRGIVDDQAIKKDGNVQIVNFLTSSELKDVILNAEIIIARSGYSTIMDLAVLGKKAILIPTPGQTEQEYLAKKLMEEGICFSMSQQWFDLNFALDQSKGFKGFSNIESSSELLANALDEVLAL